MGHNRKGVEVRPNSIRLTFTWLGKARKETLMTNGAPMAPTAANLRWAEKLAAEIRDKIRLGTFSLTEYFPASGSDSGTELSFGKQLDTWLDAQRIEASTKAGYSSAAKFWKTAIVDGHAFGEHPLRAVKHSDMLRALAARPNLSGKTVNNYVSVAREALELALRDGAIASNPAENIPRASYQKEPPDPFTRDEAEAIIADALARYPEAIGNHIEWRFFTGVRTSEAAGLRWPNVDLASDHMVIREAIVRGVEKDSTKTAVARTVQLNSRAKAALTRQAKHTRMLGEHVWLDPRYSTPWVEERAFRRSYWTPCLKRLGIRYRAPNHMRHSYATMMLMAGRTPAWCARQLGHSVEMFLRTYSKWLGGEQDSRELAGLEDWLNAGEFSPCFPQKSKPGQSS